MAHIDAGKTTPPNGSSFTPDAFTASAKCMKAPPPWTSWSKSGNAASRSPPLPRLSIGKARWKAQNQYHRHPWPRRLHDRSRTLSARSRWRCRCFRCCCRRSTSIRNRLAPSRHVIAFLASLSSTKWTASALTTSWPSSP